MLKALRLSGTKKKDAGCAYVPAEKADNCSVPHQGDTPLLLLYVLKAPAAGSLFSPEVMSLQNLEIVPRLLPDVRAGMKLHTIRWREREIVPGPMLYVNVQDASDTVMVWVTRVERMPLSDVAAKLGKSKEWPDAELLEGMRDHYPRIEMDSEVVVIHHLPPEA